MKTAASAIRSIFLSALLVVATTSALAATSYSVKNAPADISTLRAISPTGIVVGNAYAPIADINREIAVLWDAAGTIHELIPGSDAASQAFDINASGQVLVYSDNTVAFGQGTVVLPVGVYIWQNDVLTPLNLNVSLDPYNSWLAFNDSAQVMGTGSFTTASGIQKHAFLVTNGVITDLGTLPGANASGALGINNNGDVVGYSYDANNQPRAVLWRNGNIIDLGVLPGATSSVANDINDQGVIVGSSGGRLFTWKDGVMTDLGKFSADTLASAHTINNNGDITGSANIPGTYFIESFKWSQGVFSALNPVIQNGRCRAGDINDAGQINMNCYYGNYVISPAAPAVDLGVLTKSSQYPGVQGTPLTFAIDVYNAGSLDASNVQLINPLPANASFVSVTTSQGSCLGNTTIYCDLGNLASAAKATVKLTLIPTLVSNLVNTATVSSDEVETNTPNNTGSDLVYVIAGSADLGVTMSGSASTVNRLSNLTYTINVKNNGPTTGNGVVVTDSLPSSMTFVSASSSQGTCSGTTKVSCNVGTMANGASAKVTIVVQPRIRGTYTNAVSVSTSNQDSNVTNNSASVTTRVK